MSKENSKYSWLKKVTLILTGISIVAIIMFSFFVSKRDFDNEFAIGSNIKVEELSKNQVENLEKLCKVWGLVKYYHPKVISGDVNWDYELFRVMPDVLAAKNSSDTDKILYDWIDKLGQVKENPKEDKEVILERDIDWISDEKYIDKKLSSLLIKISNTNISKRNKAYANYKVSGVTKFKNESKYSDINYNDSGYKLLSLFRYWNIIQYYYPYRDIIDEDWDSVLNEFIPKFVATKDELEYILAISELTTKIQDPHARVWDYNGVLNKYWGDKFAPIEFGLVENYIVITNIIPKYKKECNLKEGDIVIKIDDKDIFEVIKEKSKYRSLSKKSAIVNELQDCLFRTQKDEMKITIKRDGTNITENIKCYGDMEMFNIKSDSNKLLKGNIGYINPGQLKKGEIDNIMNKFMDTKGVIIDLREYPSDTITGSLGEYLMPKEVVFSKMSMSNESMPGEFILLEEGSKVGKDNKDYYKGKVTILINERSKSQSEFATMAFMQSPNATVIGSDSIGTDGNITEFSLPGNVTTSITGIGVYNPDKSQTQRIGIKPDIYIEPTIKGIKENRDELIEKAIEVIKN